ncbi:glycosyltransferase family 9 protein [Cupriavidus sp.]|uniref:glycosyltransferase family 9 protein n=1 Tax=Cupriavidus sp. TaxID=1873897 RepID=UPI0025B9F286|nr:glycosyltransferase family 9 protein [Cupriavidus sp.]MCA3191849.1 glycosyltransferase family 9 protein [Cupriavidus sp.]MCA3198080.1 glycosyltransferase family 9 protein [Cupriavidus sp.]MCA3200762.1 glycosyltransferase family 9 protein [Cupriavidus sp.]MCA3234445.1 glycosyltransferase family 9 protein [Cupriavidus sp.]
MPAAGRTIAVFRALQLGDMLCAVPALQALRAGEPDAHITLIGLPWARSFAARYSALVDDFMPFPGAPGMPEQDADAGGLERFFADARARRFDLAIQLHGSGTITNPIVRQLGARRMAGFCSGAPTPAPGECLIPWPDGNEIERLLALMHALDYPRTDPHLSFPLLPEDLRDWRRLADTHALQPGGYVCVHPGARMLSRRWPVERFAEVARGLAGPWRIVVTGAADEAALARRLCQLAGVPVVNLCGQTSLGAMAALIAHARLLICNDTGASHIAAAMNTPSVVVSCGSDSERWAPLDRTLHTVLADYPPCRPCAWQACPYGHECALNIEVDRVAAVARCLAETEREHG